MSTPLAATTGDAQVSLSWPTTAGATSYNVKRATTNNRPYTITSSSNGTTHYYVVSAVNGAASGLKIESD